MKFPDNFIPWMWLYFAVFGTLAITFVSLIFWSWMKFTRRASGALKRALAWIMGGLAIVFVGGWFACGIGGGPGNMLSTNPDIQNVSLARISAMNAMFFTVAGWILLWIGLRKLFAALPANQPEEK